MRVLRPYLRYFPLTAMAGMIIVASSFSVFSDEEVTKRLPPSRELTTLRADVQRLTTRVAELEGDALQMRDDLQDLRDEVIALKAQLGFVKSTPNRSRPIPQGIPARFDVEVTGSLASAKSSITPEDQQIARADQLIHLGDIAGARLLLEHVLRSENPLAAFKLAETYDPQRLASWQVRGVRADAERARELYHKALQGHIEHSTQRVTGH